MKNVIIVSALLFAFFCAHAQDDKIKAEINSLEQRSRQAILEKDSATLRKL